MLQKLQNKNLYFLELPFKLVYLVFAFMSFCNLTYLTPVMSIPVDAVLILGAAVAVLRFIRLKSYFKTPGIYFAVLFVLSFIVSMFMNREYGVSDNFKGLVWLCFHFFAFFACDVDRDREEYKKEFKVISVFYIAIMLVMSLASLYQFATGYSVWRSFSDRPLLRAGIVLGRLWGVFVDPNYASVFAATASIFSVYYFRKTRKAVIKVLLGLNILIQMCYLSFSDSRTGLAAVFCSAFAYAFLILVKKLKLKKALLHISSAALAFVIAVTAMAVPMAIQRTYNAFQKDESVQAENDTAAYINPVKPMGLTAAPAVIPAVKTEGITVKPLDTVGRGDSVEDNISTNRFTLWKSSIEIFRSSPLFGSSFYNIASYAKAELPDSYLINNSYGGTYTNMHNVFFNVLAGQGAFGTLVFLAFAVYLVIYIFRRIFKIEGENYEYLVTLSACAVASFVSSMFLTDVLYTNSPTSVLFWLFLGYTVHYLKTEKPEEKSAETVGEKISEKI